MLPCTLAHCRREDLLPFHFTFLHPMNFVLVIGKLEYSLFSRLCIEPRNGESLSLKVQHYLIEQLHSWIHSAAQRNKGTLSVPSFLDMKSSCDVARYLLGTVR